MSRRLRGGVASQRATGRVATVPRETEAPETGTISI
jgi:hypothetical protein